MASIFADLRDARAFGRGAVPRGVRRDPAPALLRDAAPPPAVGHRHPRRHRARSGRRWPRCARRPSALVDTGDAERARAARPDPGALRPRRGRAGGDAAVVRLQARHPVRGGHRAGRALPAQPVLRPRPVGAVGRGRGRRPVRARRPGDEGVPRRRRASWCSVPCRGSGARGSPTPPSPSAARAGVTGRWRSPRSWAARLGARVLDLHPPPRHRDLEAPTRVSRSASAV